MIKITNGEREVIVTKGVYKELYRGWTEVKSASHEPPKKEEVRVEKPISEMTVEELKAYAKEHHITVSKAKTKAEMLSAIRKEK